jgi:DNA-binding transcriptional ArsR family regulator
VPSAVTLDAARRLSDDLAVLAEPHRLLALRYLRRGPRTLGFLSEALGISQPLTSYHLSVLLSRGLVSRRSSGSFSCYAIERRRVRELHRRLGTLAGEAAAPAESDGPC